MQKPCRRAKVMSPQVTAFVNGWWQAQNIVRERARGAAAEPGEKVIFQKIDTSVKETFLE